MVKKKEKRFLIVWFGVIFFMYLCNTLPLKGTIVPHYSTDEDGIRKTAIYLFTDGSSYDHRFWPFVDYADQWDMVDIHSIVDFEKYPYYSFNGIFYDFNIRELIVYSIIGLGIVFLPKIWK